MKVARYWKYENGAAEAFTPVVYAFGSLKAVLKVEMAEVGVQRSIVDGQFFPGGEVARGYDVVAQIDDIRLGGMIDEPPDAHAVQIRPF